MSGKTRVVYIMGLSRCGSTILQFLLASHDRAVGMGEIEHTLRRYGPNPQPEQAKPCSCGRDPDRCPVWSPILPSLPTLSRADGHRRIVDHFASRFPGQVLVDNSKTRDGLALYADPDLDLRVIYVVRDFRGWSRSTVHGLRRRDPRKPVIAPPGPVRSGYWWLVANAKGLASLARRRLPTLYLSYERLMFDTRRQLARVGRFVGLELDPDRLDLADSTHHDLFGNPMKQDADRRTRVVYNDSWKREWRPGIGAPLLLPVYLANLAAHRIGR